MGTLFLNIITHVCCPSEVTLFPRMRNVLLCIMPKVSLKLADLYLRLKRLGHPEYLHDTVIKDLPCDTSTDKADREVSVIIAYPSPVCNTSNYLPLFQPRKWTQERPWLSAPNMSQSYISSMNGSCSSVWLKC